MGLLYLIGCFHTTRNLAELKVRVLLSLQADKHTLVMQLGIPYRDLRVLDPLVRTIPVAATR